MSRGETNQQQRIDSAHFVHLWIAGSRDSEAYPAARARIIRSSAYTPPTISTSGVSPYSSMATHKATTSAVRRSSPRGEQGLPGHEHIWPETNSRRKTAMGAEGAVIVQAKGLILLYTLFDEPLPAPVALTTQVHRVWLQALNHISDAGNIQAS